MGLFGVIFWGKNRGGNRDGRGDFSGEIFRGGGEVKSNSSVVIASDADLTRGAGGFRCSDEDCFAIGDRLYLYFMLIALSKGSLLAMTTGVGLTRERGLEKDFKKVTTIVVIHFFSRR